MQGGRKRTGELQISTRARSLRREDRRRTLLSGHGAERASELSHSRESGDSAEFFRLRKRRSAPTQVRFRSCLFLPRHSRLRCRVKTLDAAVVMLVFLSSRRHLRIVGGQEVLVRSDDTRLVAASLGDVVGKHDS